MESTTTPEELKLKNSYWSSCGTALTPTSCWSFNSSTYALVLPFQELFQANQRADPDERKRYSPEEHQLISEEGGRQLEN